MADVVTTNEIMEFLQEHMVTKTDLDNRLKDFVTKEYLDEGLKGFATKEDLKGFVTKEDLNIFKFELLDRIDDKFADYSGENILRQRKQDRKVNKIVDSLEAHKVVPSDEIHAIRSIKIFPST